MLSFGSHLILPQLKVTLKPNICFLYMQNATSSIKTGKWKCRKQSNDIKLPHLLQSERTASTSDARMS